MAAMGPKMAENFQNSMILKKHTFVPEFSYKIVKKLIFLHKMLYSVNFWPFWGFLAILTPFQSSDNSETEILPFGLQNCATNNFYKTNFLIRAMETPQIATKWP